MNQLDLILENIRLSHTERLLQEAQTDLELVRGQRLINESVMAIRGALMEEGVYGDARDAGMGRLDSAHLAALYGMDAVKAMPGNVQNAYANARNQAGDMVDAAGRTIANGGVQLGAQVRDIPNTVNGAINGVRNQAGDMVDAAGRKIINGATAVGAQTRAGIDMAQQAYNTGMHGPSGNQRFAGPQAGRFMGAAGAAGGALLGAGMGALTGEGMYGDDADLAGSAGIGAGVGALGGGLGGLRLGNMRRQQTVAAGRSAGNFGMK
jgi:hypothetical protein